MGIGGRIGSREQALEARLVRAYTGHTRFRVTGWRHLHWKFWVLDYLNHGQQPQRIGGGGKFTRLSGVAALYRPGTRYHERQTAGGSLDESYLLFRLTGEMETAFKGLMGRGGCCHFRDPERLLGDRLRQIGERLFHRRPGFRWLAQGAFLELLGLLLTAQPLAAQNTAWNPSAWLSAPPATPPTIMTFIVFSFPKWAAPTTHNQPAIQQRIIPRGRSLE
jgi:hypothetical protein